MTSLNQGLKMKIQPIKKKENKKMWSKKGFIGGIIGTKNNKHRPCPFCKIIKKEIPSNIIYEDRYIIAFLDVNPISKGHTLITPKKHYRTIFETPESTLAYISRITKKVADMITKNLEAEGVNILHASGKEAQQSVDHIHYHIIPRYKNDGINTWPKSKYHEKNIIAVKDQILRKSAEDKNTSLNKRTKKLIRSNKKSKTINKSIKKKK